MTACLTHGLAENPIAADIEKPNDGCDAVGAHVSPRRLPPCGRFNPVRFFGSVVLEYLEPVPPTQH